MYVFIYLFTCRILPDLSLGVRALLAVGQDPHWAAVFRAVRPTAGAHVCLVTHTLTQTHHTLSSHKEVAIIVIDLCCGFALFFSLLIPTFLSMWNMMWYYWLFRRIHVILIDLIWRQIKSFQNMSPDVAEPSSGADVCSPCKWVSTCIMNAARRQ